MSDPRKYTNYLYDMIAEGLIPDSFVVSMCLKYMSEAEVEDMLRVNDLLHLVEED